MRQKMHFTNRFFSFLIITALAFTLGAGQLWPQNQDGSAGTSGGVSEGSSDGEYEALPRSFRNISLGMDLDALKDTLTRDGLFQFRGDRDVSFLPSREQNLIETAGYSFVRRAFFQLSEGKLFIMAFSLDAALIDHYSVYTSFVKKYGEPALINPREAVWESGDVRVSIERPLTVKYIDLQVFNGIVAESEKTESRELYLREEFLNGF
jgi:hypothetical protein